MRVNENSQAQITAQFFDFSNAPAAPSAIRYKVNDKVTNTEMVPWTTVGTSQSVEFTVPAGANIIINDAKVLEVKTVTVQSDAGLSSQHTEETTYELVNLSAIT